jgi:hypothetical protein
MGNYEEIVSVVEQKLVPTFEMLGKILKTIDDKASKAQEMAQQIVDCMSDAVTGQRQGSFQELLGSKYSSDLGPLDQFYSDTFGTKFSDMLIDELLKSDVENPDEFISSRINENKGKYGKYLGVAMPANPGIPVEEYGPPETPEEIGVPPGAPGMSVSIKAKGHKKPSSKDMADLLGLKLSPV